VRSASKAGAFSMIAFALLGIAWFASELAPQVLGFENTDDPAVSLRFLRDHQEIYAQAGIVLILMGITMTVGMFTLWDLLSPRADSLALRSTSAIGLFSAAFFLMHGVLRLSVGPLLYIDGLDRDWGEAGYLVLQMVGVHGFAQGAVFTLCTWAIGISLIGVRTRAIPLAVCVLGVIPAVRLLGLLGPLDALPDELGFLWIFFMASIPGVMVWCLLLGVALLRGGAANAHARTEPSPVGA
jgi:hypothetical protein